LLYGAALGNVVRGVPLDSDGFFFIPLWTNFQPGQDPGIVDWYTLLIGAAAFTALALHGCYWVVLKTNGDLQQRSRHFGRRFWWAVVAFTVIITVVSFRLQPNILKEFSEHAWGYVFPLLTFAGLAGMRIWSARELDLYAFLSSCLYLVGMLTSTVFGVFPYVLPSNSPQPGLTVTSAAAAEYGLYVGLAWWIPGMALALLYSVFVYRRFAGKVAG
jgi:cytochrome d ubiquinol oxidase subunit II